MKKTLIFVLIVLVCILSSCDIELRKDGDPTILDQVETPDGFKKGDGSEANPYVIATAEQFKTAFSQDTVYAEAIERSKIYYKLANDIVVDGTVAYYLNNVVLDGNNKVLSVDKILGDDSYTDVAVFKVARNSTIQNLTYNYQYKGLICSAGRGDVVLKNVAIKGNSTVVFSKNSGAFVWLAFEFKNLGNNSGNTENDSLTFINCTNYLNITDDSVAPYFGVFVGGAADALSKTITFDSCRNEGNVDTSGNVGVLIGNPYNVTSKVKIVVKDFVNTGIIKGSETAGRVNSLFTMYESINNNNVTKEGTVQGEDKVSTIPNPKMYLESKETAEGNGKTYTVNLGSLDKNKVASIQINGIVSLKYFIKDQNIPASSHSVGHLVSLDIAKPDEDGSFFVNVPTNQIIGTHDKEFVVSEETNSTTGTIIATLKENLGKAVYFKYNQFDVCANNSFNESFDHKNNGNGIGSFEGFKISAYDADGNLLGATLILKDTETGYPKVGEAGLPK